MGRRYPIDRVSLSGSPHYHETTINLIQKLCEELDIWFIGSWSDDMSNRLISDVKVNLSRQAELDLLKAYPILFMIIIHIYENLSVGRIDPTPRTWLEHVLQFLAGPATAPAFMFAMGVGIIYSKKQRTCAVVQARFETVSGWICAKRCKKRYTDNDRHRAHRTV